MVVSFVLCFRQPVLFERTMSMNGYLIYHPPRAVSRIGSVTVYHDPIGGNEDPYVWNWRFLHTYCHITQMSPQINDINFWVSGNTFPNFNVLYCDLVFVVECKEYWPDANTITRDSPIVDSDTTYQDHYRWAMWQHRLKRRRRYTLKANTATSFQPQDATQKLLNILPMLNTLGLTLEQLQRGLRAGFNSKPMPLGAKAGDLYTMVYEAASIHLYGEELEILRQTKHP